MGAHAACRRLFIALISSGKKAPAYCVLPVAAFWFFSVMYMADFGVTDSRRIYFLSPRRQAILKDHFWAH